MKARSTYRLPAPVLRSSRSPQAMQRAQDDVSKYPTRPIHIIVGFAAGGGNDIIARDFRAEIVGRPRPAGHHREQAGRRRDRGDRICREIASRTATRCWSAPAGMAINPAVYAKLPYDSLRDFVAISELGSYPLILIVNASSPIKSVADLVAYAKANPTRPTMRVRRPRSSW